MQKCWYESRLFHVHADNLTVENSSMTGKRGYRIKSQYFIKASRTIKIRPLTNIPHQSSMYDCLRYRIYKSSYFHNYQIFRNLAKINWPLMVDLYRIPLCVWIFSHLIKVCRFSIKYLKYSSKGALILPGIKQCNS